MTIRKTIQIGARYGKMIVVKELPTRGVRRSTRRWFLLLCDCGKKIALRLDAFDGRNRLTCGCHRGPPLGNLKLHPLFNTWKSMKSRCDDPTRIYYGARGISVCDEWRRFPVFLDWALNHDWRPGLYLDRIDNDQGYSAANCRWVTASQSNKNRRPSGRARLPRINVGDFLSLPG